jgi:geranylgeranyl reductase family protein
MIYDVIVIGAGPAGSTSAKLLAERGHNVLLIDKDKFPRDKPCGGGLPLRVLKRYSYVNNDKIIEDYCYSGTAFSPSLKSKVETNRKTPMIGTTLRKIFDFELVNYAKKSGAIFQDGKKVTDIKINDKKARIILDDGSHLDSKIIIGADGVWSVVAKKLGLRKKGFEYGVCVLQEIELDEKTMDKYFKKTRHCYVHSRYGNITGYGWVFPKKEHLNIGIGGGDLNFYKDKKINLLKIYKNYISYLQKNNMIPDNYKTTPIKGGALPIYPLEKTFSKRAILIGDAGGFINPLSGEGIYYAMLTGEIAAKVINDALEKEKYSEIFLSKYQTLWKKEFGKDLKLIKKLLLRGAAETSEKIFWAASKDEVLADLIFGVISGEVSIQKCKWKLLRKYLLVLLKNRYKE